MYSSSNGQGIIIIELYSFLNVLLKVYTQTIIFIKVPTLKPQKYGPIENISGK
jgi:hypothetical protein